MKQTDVILALSHIPYPTQVKNLEIEENCIRFTWRDNNFRASNNGFVEEAKDGMLIGSDVSILMQRIIKTAVFAIALGKDLDDG